MKLNFKKIIKRNNTFLFWILLALSIDYLCLFFIESILPSYVMPYLNLNILLILILAGWLMFTIFAEFPKLSKFTIKIFQIFLIAIFFFGTWFTLYKLTNWEFLVSLFFLTIISLFLLKTK